VRNVVLLSDEADIRKEAEALPKLRDAYVSSTSS